MANHHKPTKEELERGMKESLEKLENQPSPSPSSAAPSPSTTPSTSPSPSKAPASFSASPSPSEPAPSGTPSPSPSEAPPDDENEKLKKKLSNSSREAQVLHLRTKKYDDAVEEAENIQPPTDEEMVDRYGKDEWEEMSTGSKQLAKDTWIANKRFEIMSKVSKEGRDVEKWNQKVDAFIDNPKTLNKYTELEGKQEDFKLFATKPSRRGLDMEDLVLAFNGELAKNPRKKNKGKMFESPSPGNNEKPKPKDGKISLAQGEMLRKTDYKKYKEMLKAKKIRET